MDPMSVWQVGDSVYETFDSLGENTENDGADRLLLADKLSSFRTP